MIDPMLCVGIHTWTLLRHKLHSHAEHGNDNKVVGLFEKKGGNEPFPPFLMCLGNLERII